MAQNQWIVDLENKVFSLVKGKTYSKLKEKYPGILYTTTSMNYDAKSNFPCVYIHQLGNSETHSDLERSRVSTITAGYQIEVYSNVSQRDCMYIMAEITDCMKQLLFTVKLSPYVDNQAPTFRCIARFERILDWNDIF